MRSICPSELVAGIKKLKVKGNVVKVLIGLGELPNFTAMPGTGVGPQHTGGITINPSMAYLEGRGTTANADSPPAAVHGLLHPERDRRWIAPEGKHTMSLFVQYAPYDLAEGTWDERRDEIGNNIIDTLAEYAPNLPNAIEHMKVLGPPDIEANHRNYRRQHLPRRNRAGSEVWLSSGTGVQRLSNTGRRALPLRIRRVAGRSRLRCAWAERRLASAGRSRCRASANRCRLAVLTSRPSSASYRVMGR